MSGSFFWAGGGESSAGAADLAGDRGACGGCREGADGEGATKDQ